MTKSLLSLSAIALLSCALALPVQASTTSGTISTGISGETVADPNAYPAGGTYTSSQTVTLTAGVGAEIHYSVNGATPNCAVGPIYSSPLHISANTTLKVIACKSVYGSNVKTYTFSFSCSTVAHGTTGSYPDCTVTCTTGYRLSGGSCVAKSSGGGSSYSGSSVSTPTKPTSAPTDASSNQNVPSCSLALYPTKPIRMGAANDNAQVKLLEQYLNAFEDASLPVDGVYSVTDEAAVKKWQEKYASDILAPWGETQGTGYIFTTSLLKLKSLFLGQCAGGSASMGGTTASIVQDGVRNLQFGMTGGDVRSLQTLLIAQNGGSAAQALAAHGATGNFAALTLAALAEYQKAHGIAPAAGYFGAVTRAEMKGRGLAGLWW